MTLLMFDCETTGLPDFKVSKKADGQPRIVQLGAILFNKEWEEINHMSVLLRPDGWSSAAGALAAHGIPLRRCELYGVRQKAAVALFMDFVRAASEISSYNLPFDEFMIEIELSRLGASPVEWKRGGMARTCVMQAAAQEFNGGRSMKLQDAHAEATGIEYIPTHRALNDARAAARILREIRT